MTGSLYEPFMAVDEGPEVTVRIVWTLASKDQMLDAY